MKKGCYIIKYIMLYSKIIKYHDERTIERTYFNCLFFKFFLIKKINLIYKKSAMVRRNGKSFIGATICILLIICPLSITKCSWNQLY